MKWILFVVVALLLAVGLAFAVGALQPKQHVAAVESSFRKPPAEVWTLVADFPRWPEWNSEVERVEERPARDGKPVWALVGKWGEMPSIVEVSEPPRRLVTRIPADAELGFTGTWTWEIEAVNGATKVRITEAGEVGNPLFRFFMLVTGETATMRACLHDLGKALGDEVEPISVDAGK